ncbi:TetR/AcrR family transcriptional regulator [Streptosporangium canum]|uniref:TetR/AcrR family transcriptional regulator n=1 Tax=Streptosporangium canum TaxID=324952 RepID=UPI0036754791
MSEITPPRRRRADADRSASEILRATKGLLAVQPHASVEEIAVAAGVSRQTVYAHFKTREALIGAVFDEITAEAAAQMDAAQLDREPAVDALLHLLDISWRTLQRYPLLLTVSTSAADGKRHESVFDHLERVLSRGRQSGEFASDLPVPWLVTAIVTLGHAAGDEVRAGRMTPQQASDALARSALLLCGAD